MNCRRVRALLSAYIDKEMTGQEMLEITRHLSDCVGCSEEHESFKQVKSLLSALPLTEPDPQWLTSLSISAHDLALPFYERWRLRLFTTDIPLNFNMRRMTSAVMLSSVALFLVSASFDHNVRNAEPAISSSMPSQTQVHYSSGSGFQSAEWFQSNVNAETPVPTVTVRDFPVSRRVYWPASDPMPAFGPRQTAPMRSNMMLVDFGGHDYGRGSR